MTEDKEKLPMYYQQIYNLMNYATKYSLERKGFSWFKALKNLYSRVSFKLENDDKEHLSKKIKDITEKYIPTADRLNLLSPLEQKNLLTKNNLEIQLVLEELQQELFDAMNKVGIFDYLEKHNYELGDR